MDQITKARIGINFGRFQLDPTSLKVYDLQLDKVMEVITAHNWSVRYFNSDNPKPKGRGYKDGELWIYDPRDPSGRFREGEEYAHAWRLLHEFAHAETEGKAIARFGPTKRGGRLGWGMDGRAARQALWWEIEAVIFQHSLAECYFNLDVTRADLHRELNVTLYDGLIRIVTGEFSNPDDDGFIPYDTAPNWKDVCALIDAFERQAYRDRDVWRDSCIAG